MSIRAKAILASIIWITVFGLAWHAFRNVLPQYGFFVPQPPSRLTPQERNKLYQEEEAKAKAFLASTGKPTDVDAEMAEPGDNLSYDGKRSEPDRELVYARNAPLRQIISRLSGIPARRVVESVTPSTRWNIEAILPPGQEESVRALLKEIKWKGDYYALPERVFVFKEGTPPPVPEVAAGGGGCRGSMPLGTMTLGQVARQLQGWSQSGIRVDRAVRNRKPVDPNRSEFRFGGSPQQMAAQLASIYGVSLSLDTEDTTHILLYPSGSKTGGDMDQWIKSLREKAIGQ